MKNLRQSLVLSKPLLFKPPEELQPVRREKTLWTFSAVFPYSLANRSGLTASVSGPSQNLQGGASASASFNTHGYLTTLTYLVNTDWVPTVCKALL